MKRSVELRLQILIKSFILNISYILSNFDTFQCNTRIVSAKNFVPALYIIDYNYVSYIDECDL